METNSLQLDLDNFIEINPHLTIHKRSFPLVYAHLNYSRNKLQNAQIPL